MTYRTIYNKLDKKGIIDAILGKTNNDKMGIIKGIEGLLEYETTAMGRHMIDGMKYWKAKECNEATSYVLEAYAKIKIEENEAEAKKWAYMKEVHSHEEAK